ncbi:MAG: alpha/beta hydrolase [Sulfurimonas sp.]|nr:alpha/beta hydrolase [Sulfurimonas sp.]
MIYVAFLSFTLLILLFGLYQWQYFMIFSPTYYRDGELDDSFEILTVITDDGVELEGVVYELSEPHATLLFFAGRSHDSVGLIKKLSLGFPHVRVISFNYRSYGRSGGVVNEKNILADGLKIAELVQKNYGDFYILGFSIGSSVASFVASKAESKGVFLVGSFDSISGLARQKHGVNLSWFLRYKFDNSKFVENISAKTYLFVSRDDEITYIENSRILKSHVKNLAFYGELDNLMHKELLWDSEVIDKINGIITLF